MEKLVKEYDDLFHGLGKLKGKQVTIHIDESVQPVAQPHRRVPFHVREQLEEQLAKDEEQGAIEVKVQHRGLHPSSLLQSEKLERLESASTCDRLIKQYREKDS